MLTQKSVCDRNCEIGSGKTWQDLYMNSKLNSLYQPGLYFIYQSD